MQRVDDLEAGIQELLCPFSAGFGERLRVAVQRVKRLVDRHLTLVNRFPIARFDGALRRAMRLREALHDLLDGGFVRGGACLQAESPARGRG